MPRLVLMDNEGNLVEEIEGNAHTCAQTLLRFFEAQCLDPEGNGGRIHLLPSPADEKMSAEAFLKKFPTTEEENKNCLVDIACPHCGSRGTFTISGQSGFEMGDDGTEGHGDIEWNDCSSIQCEACQKAGSVGNFRIENLEEAIEEERQRNIAHKHLSGGEPAQI